MKDRDISSLVHFTAKIVSIFFAILMVSGTVLGVANRDVIIGFHQQVGPSENALIHSHGGIVKNSFHLIPAIAAQVPEDHIETMKKDPRVAYIENDSVFKAADEYTNSWGVQHIGSQAVHNQNINGTRIKVAILDTGIDYNHEDLKDNYKGGYDFAFNTTNPFDDSYNSHGTHVAGIIAAEKNGIGVVGVAPNASIYAVKVLDGAGFGLASWIISGIQWAVDNNMTIATMSIQGSDVQSLHDAVDNAYNSGLLLVAAGGNTNGGNVSYPAAYDSVIAVTATDSADQRASFSSIGPEIELAAPGVNIYSTVRGGYAYMSGTSQATPHVTGAAALVFSSNFSDVNGDGIRNNKDVRSILQLSAKDLGDIGKDSTYGYGLVDAQKAVLNSSTPTVIELILARTNGSPDNDAKNVSLLQGNYSITIRNINLSRLNMEVYENGVIRNDLSSKFRFDGKPDEINFNLYAGNTLDIVFTPYGSQKSIVYVTIRGS